MRLISDLIRTRFVVLITSLTVITALFSGLLTAQTLQPCDDSKTPVVFVHGFLGSGDTWAPQVQRFASNGICNDRFFVFDWNSTGGVSADMLLGKFIDSVLILTGAERIHLVGHSAGGGRCYSYLSEPVRADRVISYVHIGSSANRGPAGPEGSVPTMNIYSTGDKVVRGSDIPGAVNVKLEGQDHYQVATSSETFRHMYRFFYGEEPLTDEIVPSEKIVIAGKCLSLGTNQPSAEALIQIFETDIKGNPGTDPVATIKAGITGDWGPVSIRREKVYMFKISSERSAFRSVIYYFEPFLRDNHLVYLRTFPPASSLAGLLLASIPADDRQSVISIFSSSQAIISGRDELTIEGIELSTVALASEAATMISLFCFDAGGDNKGMAEPMASFAAMPFLQGADLPVQAETDETWVVTLNGRSIPVRNWRSKSDGVVIAVFR